MSEKKRVTFEQLKQENPDWQEIKILVSPKNYGRMRKIADEVNYSINAVATVLLDKHFSLRENTARMEIINQLKRDN